MQYAKSCDVACRNSAYHRLALPLVTSADPSKWTSSRNDGDRSAARHHRRSHAGRSSGRARRGARARARRSVQPHRSPDRRSDSSFRRARPAVTARVGHHHVELALEGVGEWCPAGTASHQPVQQNDRWLATARPQVVNRDPVDVTRRAGPAHRVGEDNGLAAGDSGTTACGMPLVGPRVQLAAKLSPPRRQRSRFRFRTGLK